MKKSNHYLSPIMVLNIPVIIGFILASSRSAIANGVIDSVSIRVPAACTLSSSIAQGQAHNASIAGGVYKPEIGTTNLKIVCNDNSGFSLYAVGFTDDIHGRTTLSSSLGSSYDIITGTAEDGNNSNWAMKVDAIPNATYDLSIENGFDSYSAVPSRFARVATRNTGTDVGQQAVGSNLTTTYAVYISKTQPPGSYIGQVKYTLVHPYNLDPPQDYETESGYIGYYPNATSYVGTFESQAIGQTDTSATLSPSTFYREGYGFAGWNDRFDYTGTFYGPNETISFEAGQYSGDNKGLSLYAVWKKSEGDLQNWNGCSSMRQGDVTALTDQRDNQTYAVAKLADGKCWTIENMRIDDSVNADAMIAGSDSLGTGFSVLPQSSNSWSANTTLVQFNNSNYINGNISYGNYYSWPAAIASTTSYSIETADTSICPFGWRLPRGGRAVSDSNNDYYVLMKTLTNEEPNINKDTGFGYYSGVGYSNSIREYPNNFVYSGRWYGNSASTVDESGFYWTSSSYGTAGTEAYYLYFNNNMVRPGDGHAGKYYGNSFRCVKNS